MLPRNTWGGLSPVQCGQVGTQPCSQVKEDHIEQDAYQGKKTQKVCPTSVLGFP